MKRFAPILSLLILPTSLFAHTSHGTFGFSSGFTHPVLGMDHLLAMLSVGMLSAQIGGRAIWTIPATFVAFMLVGGVFGMNEIPFFSVEIGIAISVLTLGLAIAADKKLPVLLAMVGVGFFALFHGHAHGEEMPSSAQPLLYALGFILGTALIHIAGVAIGWTATRIPRATTLLRFGGALIALLGSFFLFQACAPEKLALRVSSTLQP
ncbi:MAG: HupE/UreJ family protein [Aliarcobacter sp.]